MFEKLENALRKIFDPITEKISGNTVLNAVSKGCVSTVPVTVGVVLITVLINLPFAGYKEFLESSGLLAAGTEVSNVTISLLPVYLIMSVSYAYCSEKKQKGIIGSVLAMAVFLIMVPSTLTVGENQVTALSADYLGSKGIFLALIIGVITAAGYCKLMDSNLRIKLPDSVPPMVSVSLSSCIPSIVILTVAFAVKYAFTLTSFGNIIDAVNTLIQQPIMSLGATPAAFIIFTLFCNLLWFFGIHPSAITGLYTPIIVSAIVANQEAFAAGQPLPYGALMVVYLICNLGGYGGTLGFCLNLLTAKSEEYKKMKSLYIVPNIFNINEPIIFGVPLCMNPIYFIPMTIAQPIGGLIAWALYSMFPFAINPTYQLGLPWVTPPVITAFAEGGLLFLLIAVLAIAIDWILYLPFFRIDDSRKTAMEKQASSAEAAN
jgi:PTS system cellobiose-specific IIC component